MYKYFDTHCHYNIEPLSESIDQLEHGTIGICVIGTCYLDSIKAIEIAKNKPYAYASIGIHPSESNSINIEQEINKLEDLLLQNKDHIVAIGECGLDYHYEGYIKDNQESLFRKQIELAIKYNLTLVLHIREAHKDAQDILAEYDLENINVIIHCYTDNIYNLEPYINRGYYISIPGVVTFKNANDLRDAVKIIPIDKLLTETDSPFLAPIPLRGTVNNSTNVRLVNEYLANFLNIDLEQLNNILVQNAMKVYKI